MISLKPYIAPYVKSFYIQVPCHFPFDASSNPRVSLWPVAFSARTKQALPGSSRFSCGQSLGFVEGLRFKGLKIKGFRGSGPGV